MFRDIWEFARAVARHWAALVTGAVITIVLGVVPEVAGLAVPPTAWKIALVVALLFACFLAWREQYHRTSARDGAKNELARYRAAGVDLQARGHALRSTIELTDWVKAHVEWRSATIEYMKPRFPEHQWSRFESLGLLPPLNVPHLDSYHLSELQRIALEIHRLDDILLDKT